METPKNVNLIKAEYVSDYKFLFTFSNGKKCITDFYPIISYGDGCIEFLDKKKFKEIKFDKKNGHIYCGKDWDMCFSISVYYMENQVKPAKQKAGRKPVEDKKMLVRLYIHESIVNSHGGMELAQKKCTNFLNEKQLTT